MPKTQKYWIFIQNDQFVLVNNHLIVPNSKDITSLLSFVLRDFFLGIIDETVYYCAEINQLAVIPHPFELVALKQALAMIYPYEYTIGVKAYSIVQWDKNHQFCGRCGTQTDCFSKQGF